MCAAEEDAEEGGEGRDRVPPLKYFAQVGADDRKIVSRSWTGLCECLAGVEVWGEVTAT